ncbi:hypothetical protein AVEN_151377-1 [Araneus ventricosus]|uniref:Tc1-like transposase DDE domain-containing protein n=1 Tax=Araneus ventricosus TaxID=182803 RepID=A0A4Y2CAU0_ARAVE|nr:hypothetical protein AVEN_151377-1 [Araneus ventricosus]
MFIVHSDGLGQFQQDNATPHASRVTTKWLQEHSSDFRHFHWLPKSPGMNIIEDIWDATLHAVEKRSPPPRTPMDLLTALQHSGCEFPPGYCGNSEHRAFCACAELIPTTYIRSKNRSHSLSHSLCTCQLPVNELLTSFVTLS